MALERYNYGLVFDHTRRLNDLEVELICFRELGTWEGKLSRKQHFMNAVELLWGPKSRKEFIWHPWAEWYLEHSCEQKYLAVLGAANSGKTDFFAVWALVNWLCSPFQTKVMVTSTSLKESRKRIWGAVREYYMGSSITFPGKLVDSIGIIRVAEADGVVSDRAGIELVPGEKKKEKEAVGKLIGIKAKRIILICDELPELSHALIGAFKSNLAVNPHSQLIGIGNFASMYDPLGELARPKAGYDSITPEDIEWETEDGYCIRADGLKSPNILAGKDIYPFIYNSKNLAGHRKDLGPDSLLFWRMCRSYPCPESVQDVIFSEADLLSGQVNDKVLWIEPPIKVAAIDPSFTSHGDRNAVAIASYGEDVQGRKLIVFNRIDVLHEQLSMKNVPVNRQIALQFKALCEKEGIAPEHTAYDSSAGGGILFGELLKEVWSSKPLGIQFGGSASEMRVSISDNRKAREAYSNRVTEIWYTGLEFLRAGQIRGITSDLGKELKARHYETVKTGAAKTAVETKKDMKKRVGFSPDLADAALMAIMLCRERLNAIPGDKVDPSVIRALHPEQQQESANQMESNADYSADNWESFTEEPLYAESF